MTVSRLLPLALAALCFGGCPSDNTSGGDDGGGNDLSCNPLSPCNDLGVRDSAVLVDQATFDLTPDAAHAPSHGLYFYLTSANPTNAVSGFAMDPVAGGGALINENPTDGGVVGALRTGLNPLSATATADGRFLYVPNDGDSTISAYAVDAATGRLTRLDADAVTAGVQDFPAGVETHPTSLAIDAAGAYLYTANSGSNDVSAFAIDHATGAVTAVGAAVPAGDSPRRVVLDATGTLLFSINNGGPSVSVYTVAAGVLTRVDQDGVTTGVQDFTGVGNGVIFAAAHPSKRVLYVSAAQANAVDALSFTNGGLLSALAAVPAGTSPFGVAVDPSGAYLYAANYGSTWLSGYSLDAAGAPTALPNTTTLAQGRALTFSPSGAFAYLYCDSGGLYSFALDGKTGTLTAGPMVGTSTIGTYEIGVASTTY